MNRKIRVASVDYLNAKPLIYGFENEIANQMDLVLDYPAKIARMLLNDEVDVGLVPVATIPALEEHHIISDYCIGCNGEVASVCLFSDVPIEQIESVVLDYQSRTSVALFRILLNEHWKLTPVLLEGGPGFESRIKGKTAGLVIGDRALKQRRNARYIYDLGTAWKEMTGLPFVFAAWISNKELPGSFTDFFNSATGAGLTHLEEIVAANPFEGYNLYKYYTQDVDYRLDDEKRTALKLFLSYLSAYK